MVLLLLMLPLHKSSAQGTMAPSLHTHWLVHSYSKQPLSWPAATPCREVMLHVLPYECLREGPHAHDAGELSLQPVEHSYPCRPSSMHTALPQAQCSELALLFPPISSQVCLQVSSRILKRSSAKHLLWTVLIIITSSLGIS